MMTTLGIFLLAALQQGPGTKPPPTRLQPMPVPRTLISARGDKHITIDGVLQDWPGVPVVALNDFRQVSGMAFGAWREPRDLTATAFFLWDEDNLFFAAKVVDDWHRRLTRKAPRLLEIPPADSIMLTFDPNRDTRTIGKDPGRVEDREFWLADVEGQGMRLVQWDRYRGTAAFAAGAEMAVKRDTERHITTYEARIPWQRILPHGRKARPRMVFGLNIVVNDYDEITDPMPQTRIGWTFGMGPRIDPGQLGAAMLVSRMQGQVDEMPPFPAPPEQHGDPVPGQAYWVAYLGRLGKHPPRPSGSESGHPSLSGGIERLDLLEKLERRLAGFPRTDYLGYLQLVHRRMRREVAGIVRTGLPFFWQQALADLGRRASQDAPSKGFRIFRLPQGGWLVRSRGASFAIDPSGYDLDRYLWQVLDFVLLTSPLDMSKRNDQLLMHMSSAKRPFYCHILFHLPRVDASKMPLVKPGKVYTISGLKIRVLGHANAKGWVTSTVGYRVEWPDGTVLVHSAQSLREQDLGPGHHVDLLILSALHPRARVVGQRVQASLTILDDVLQCASHPDPRGRVRLEDAFQLQNGLRPGESLILAPGESWDVAPSK